MFEGKYVKLADDRYLIVIGEEGEMPVEIGVLVWTGSQNVRYSYLLQVDGTVSVHEDGVPGIGTLEGEAREGGAHMVRDVRFGAWTTPAFAASEDASATTTASCCGCGAEAAAEPEAKSCCGCGSDENAVE